MTTCTSPMIIVLFAAVLQLGGSVVWADSPKQDDGLPWCLIDSSIEQDCAQLRSLGPLQMDAEWTFFVTHGMCGTTAGDRFERLCTAIKQQFPRSNVVLVDWSVKSNVGSGYTKAFCVAQNIDSVAAATAAEIEALSIDPWRSTMIGESFGNYVNARVAQQLGGVEHLLAFNPASELGGYRPPNLRKVAGVSCSFHTWSIYDTKLSIAHHELFLEAPEKSSAFEQHTHGIKWLAERVEAGDNGWLMMTHPLPTRDADQFQAVAHFSGLLLSETRPRSRHAKRPEPQGVEITSIGRP